MCRLGGQGVEEAKSSGWEGPSLIPTVFHSPASPGFSFGVIVRTFHAVLIVAGFAQRRNVTRQGVILLQPNHLLSVCDDKNQHRVV